MREAPNFVGLKVLLDFIAYFLYWIVRICSWIVLSVPILFFYIILIKSDYDKYPGAWVLDYFSSIDALKVSGIYPGNEL
jgi:hypothetical protein